MTPPGDNLFFMKQGHPYNLSVTQVAEHFGLTPRSIRDRIKQSDLRAVRVGGECPSPRSPSNGPRPGLRA